MRPPSTDKLAFAFLFALAFAFAVLVGWAKFKLEHRLWGAPAQAACTPPSAAR